MAITQPAVTEQRNGPSAKQNHVTNVTRVEADANGVIRLTESHGALKSVDVADVDLVLGFADGTYVIIPNGALDALEPDAPTVEFDGDKYNTSLSELFKLVGTVDAADAGNLRIISENIDTRLTELQPDEIDYTSLFMALNNHAAAPAAPAAPLPQAPTLPTASQVQRGSINGRGNNSGEMIEAIIPPRVDQPSTYRLGNRVETGETLQNIGSPVVSGQLYVASEFKTGTDFRNDLPLGARGATDSSNPEHNPATPSAQATREVINAIGNVSLNQQFSQNNEGLWEKNFFIGTNFQTVAKIEITLNPSFGNLPPDFRLTNPNVNITRVGNSWTIEGPNLQNIITQNGGIDLDLTYGLTPDGTAVTGTDPFVLQVVVTGIIGAVPIELPKDFYFSYRDIPINNDGTYSEGAFDQIFNGNQLFILPARGMGYDIRVDNNGREVMAGSGADIIRGGTGNDTINGGAGNDTIYGGEGANILRGGSGNDLIIVGTGNNTVDGGQNDTINGAAKDSDTISYINLSQSVYVDLRDGKAWRDAARTNEKDVISNIENIVGSGADDLLIGDSNANHIEGGDGNDTIQGIGNTIGNGGDTLDGGTGSNTVSYADAAGDVTVNLAASRGQIDGFESDTLRNFDTVIGAINHTNNITGNGNANLLVGGDFNDTLQGGAGADTLDGGGGINTALYTTQVNVSLTPGLISATGHAAGDVFHNIQNLEATTGNNRLIGDAQDNYIKGGSGNDTLAGMGGNDTLDGGGGSNFVTYQYTTGGTGVNVDLSTGSATITGSGNSVGTDTLLNIQHVIGSGFADTISGSSGSNYIDAGNGNDLIFINNGGKDTVYGGAGDDTVVASVDAITGNVSNNWSNRFTLVDGQGGNDTLALEGFVNGAAYELATLVGLVRSVETIDISQQAYGLQASSTNMTVSTQSIQGLMASGSSSVINIIGDNTDKLSFSLGAGESVWFNGAQLGSAIDLTDVGIYAIHDANNNVVAQVNWTVA